MFILSALRAREQAEPAGACWVCVPGGHGSMCRRCAIEVRDVAWRESRPGYRAAVALDSPAAPVRRSEWRRWTAA